MGDVSDREYKAAVRGITSERAFVDRFLLAIICANRGADDEVTPEQRLSDAKEALFGDAKASGNDFIDDGKALAWMAKQYIADRGGPGIRIGKPPGWYPEKFESARGVRKLARQAASLTTGQSDEAIEERLRRKFRKERDWLLFTVTHDDDVASCLAMKNLQRLRKLLSVYGIDMQLEDQLGRKPGS